MNMFDKLLARIQAATLAVRHRPRKKPRAEAAPAAARGHTKRRAEKAPAKPKHRKGRAR
jgi:hypothetical protein